MPQIDQVGSLIMPKIDQVGSPFAAKEGDGDK